MSFRGKALAILVLGACSCAEPEPADSPEDAQLVGEDIERFWQSYDEGLETGDMEDALERGYRAPGTGHLSSFFQLRVGTAAELAETTLRNRLYYESVREETLALAAGGEWWDEARAAFIELERIEPKVVFPPVVFAIGRMSSGGLTSNSRILVGLELFTRQETSPLDSLTPAEVASTRRSQHLLPFVVHQLAHVQQERLGHLRSIEGRTLLERALFEGIAELITEVLTGQVVGTEAAAYGAMHEAELWAEFQTEMNGTDVAGWLYSDGSNPERPGDLGYFIGYRIARTFADAWGNDEQVIPDLLRTTSANRLLSESGYAPE